MSLVRGISTLATVVTVLALASVLVSVVGYGLRGLSHVVGAELSRAVAGTARLVVVACALALPLGLLAGIHLAEARAGRLVAAARVAADALAAVPSVVFGVLVYGVVWRTRTGHGGDPSTMTCGAALALVMVPTVARATEIAIRGVPERLREAALALGATRFHVIVRVVMPSAARGIATGVLLAIARATGEAAPLVLLGSDASSALSVSVYRAALSPLPALQSQAWGLALVLVALVLALHVAAWLLSPRREEHE